MLVDEVERVDDALAQFRAVYEADGENATALGALERLYRDTRALRRAPRNLREEARARDRPADKQADPLRDRALYESEIKDPEARHRDATSRCSTTSRPTPQALSALDMLYRELKE